MSDHEDAIENLHLEAYWEFIRPPGETRSRLDYSIEAVIQDREAFWAKLEPEWSRAPR